LIVSKSGTHDINSERNSFLIVLCEISTGNYPCPPPDTIDDFHTANNDSNLPLPCPYLSPTLEESSTTLQLLQSPAAVNEPFDYQAQINKITALINLMRQQWPLPTLINQGHPTLPSNITDSQSDPSPALSLSHDDKPIDYKSTLVEPTAATNQMMHCWPLPSALYVVFTPATLVLSPASTPATPQALMTAPLYPGTPPHAASPNSSEHLPAATTTNPNDRTLLAAATALDNFLLQHPHKLNLPEHIPCPMPIAVQTCPFHPENCSLVHYEHASGQIVQASLIIY